MIRLLKTIGIVLAIFLSIIASNLLLQWFDHAFPHVAVFIEGGVALIILGGMAVCVYDSLS